MSPYVWRRSAAAALLVLLLPLLFGIASAEQPRSPAAAPDAQTLPLGEDWFSVHLEGRKIGQLRSQREVDSDGITTNTEMRLELERNGQRLQLVSRQRTLETTDGRPLGFSNFLDAGGAPQSATGTVVDGTIHLVRSLHIEGMPATGSDETMPWPDNALLPEGQRLAAVRAGATPDTHYRISQFDLDALRPFETNVRVIGRQTVEVHGANESLLAVTQRLDLGGSEIEMAIWLDPETFLPRRLSMPMLGVTLEMLACDRACATAPNQPSDVLAATSVASPKPLSRSERGKHLVYELAIDDPSSALRVPIPGQQRSRHGDRLRIVVDPAGGAEQQPVAADLQSTRWLQSDHPELLTLADKLVGRSTDPARVMRKLEAGVGRHLATKSLRIGYASALDAARLKEGDCTEHALLLAALARARGIPARVATGLAYAPNFSGREDTFVPHAWVYAWIDGRWRGYDAALPSFGSGHLALDIGDGDPFGFYSDVSLLGRLSITSIETDKP